MIKTYKVEEGDFMDDFLVKLQRRRSEFFGRMKLFFILDVAVIFSIFYAIFIIFNMEYFLNRYMAFIQFPVKMIPPLFSLITGIVIGLFLHKKDRKINVSILIENKYSELKEKLRTAYDNRDEENVIVDSLKNQVSEALDKVSISKILTGGKLFLRLIITILFLAGAATVAFNPDKYAIPVDTLTNISEALTGTTEETTNVTLDVAGVIEDSDKAGTDGGGNITGKPRIAPIEGKKIDLGISGGSETGFEIKKVSQTQNQFIKSAAFPVDVLGSNVSDGGYSILMKKTETEKELINKYAIEQSRI
jgi:uncharacterized integral membrane protein